MTSWWKVNCQYLPGDGRTLETEVVVAANHSSVAVERAMERLAATLKPSERITAIYLSPPLLTNPHLE